MLKIIVSDSPKEQRWSLQGRLAGQWVSTLKLAWTKGHNEANSRRCLVDLNEVTFIDRSGEVALAEMMRDGAEFIANGLYTKELLRHLRAEWSDPSRECEEKDGIHDDE